MPISTERLILRLFTEADYPMLRLLDPEPAVLRYRSQPFIPPELTRQFLERARASGAQRPRTFFAYAIILRNKPTWLGQCGLTAIPGTDLKAGQVFLWFSLLPAYWRHGYMTEAVQALIRLAFSKLDIKIIEAECDPQNKGSARVIEKAGFTYIGQLARPDQSGKIWSRRHYELLAATYDPNRWPAVHISPPF